MLDIFVADTFAAAVAAAETVKDVLPHGARWMQAPDPITAALPLPFEAPNAGKTLGAQETPLPCLWVDVCPFNLHGCIVQLRADGPGTPANQMARAFPNASAGA